VRIGIDIHYLRLKPPRGIYYYLWNTLDRMVRLTRDHRFTFFLYSDRLLDDPADIARWDAEFPRTRRRYYFDGPRFRLLSSLGGVHPERAPAPVRFLDRRVILPAWKRLATWERMRPKRSKLVRWLWRQPPLSWHVDVMHHNAGLLLPLHARVNVLTIHDLFGYHYREDFPDTYQQVGGAFANAHCMDMIIVPTEYTKRDVVKTLGITEDRVRVTPEAAHAQYQPIDDAERVQAVRKKHGLAEFPYLLYIGAIEERKNIYRLVEAFHRLKQAHPHLTHRLVLVGGGEPKVFEAIQKKTGHFESASQVRNLGFVAFDELPALLNGADVFVFPSLLEGFGLPPLEAMSCGTPVISSNYTSLPDVVGDAGILVDPYQVDDITTAMYRVLTDSDLRRELRAKGLARAKSFTWENTARLTLSAYEDAWKRSLAEGPIARPEHHETEYGEYLRDFVIRNLIHYTWSDVRWIPPWPM
jgi:glycosyltransferase involved in cell wall biosynthesis